VKNFIRTIRRYVSPCALILVTINVAVFLIGIIVEETQGTDVFTVYGALSWLAVFEDGEYYRLITYAFLHGSMSHLINNMLVLVFLGSALESLLGKTKFVINYFCSALIAGLVSISYNRMCYNGAFGGFGAESLFVFSVGASGAVFGIIGAMLFIAVKNRGQIAGISTGQLMMYIVFSVYAGVTSGGIDNAAHIGGLIFGFISGLLLYTRSKPARTDYWGG